MIPTLVLLAVLHLVLVTVAGGRLLAGDESEYHGRTIGGILLAVGVPIVGAIVALGATRRSQADPMREGRSQAVRERREQRELQRTLQRIADLEDENRELRMQVKQLELALSD